MSQRLSCFTISNRSALPEINGKAAEYFDPDNIIEIKESKESMNNKYYRMKIY